MHDIHPYLPELFNYPGTLLYIGARVDAHSWLFELAKAANKVIILEAWRDNVEALTEMIRDGYGFSIPLWIAEGDIRDIDKMYPPETEGGFDYAFWWHGPEHLQVDEIKTVLTALETRTRRTIALACPWGIYPQGAHARNPYEVHQTTLYPEFFTELGYTVATDGEPDTAGSEIVAWKRM